MTESPIMKKLIQEFPHQLSRCIQLSQTIKTVKPQHRIHNVVVAGMGSGGIGANLVASLMMNELNVPLLTLKSYELPAFVNQHTLLIAISFSGNTEETMATVELAHKAGVEIACVTSGGKLKAFAESKKLTLAQVPSDIPTPRAAFGYSFITLLYLLLNYELISNNFEAELQEAIWLLDAQRNHIKEEAQTLADNFYGNLPVLYGDDKVAPVLVRFQQQLNENSKHLAHVNIFPEMNHNELVGCFQPEAIWKNAIVLLTQTSYDHPRVKLRMEVCESIFKEHAKEVMHLKAMGDSFLEECIYLVHLFDWVSWFLSEKNGVDAFEVKNIDYLKNILASR
jgi:glucose/mannose-6-phosphate isomerase